MKLRAPMFTVVLVLLALSMVPIAAAQTNVPMSFNGTYSAIACVGSDGCVGAGLYGGTINGVNVGSGQLVPGMICDDYADHITTGETWTASGVQVSSLNSSNIAALTLFGGGVGSGANSLTGMQVYTAVAYLANLMLTSPGTVNQAAISSAIWFITSGQTLTGLTSAAQSYVTQALNSTTPLSAYTDLYVYMPTPKGPGEAQEMFSMVAVPEGGTALSYLLLTGLCCFGAIRFRSKASTSIPLN